MHVVEHTVGFAQLRQLGLQRARRRAELDMRLVQYAVGFISRGDLLARFRKLLVQRMGPLRDLVVLFVEWTVGIAPLRDLGLHLARRRAQPDMRLVRYA